jgi:hypothetical protein
VALVAQVRQLIEQDQLADRLRQKYPLAHEVRTDKALYDYVLDLKALYLRNTPQLSKVAFDNKLHIIQHTHAHLARARRQAHQQT